MIGIGAHHLLDLPVFEKFLRVVLQMENDAGAARRRRPWIDGLDGEIARRRPTTTDRLRPHPPARETTSTREATMKAE